MRRGEDVELEKRKERRTMHPRRRKLLVLGLLSCCAIAGALLGSTMARGDTTVTPPVGAFTSTSALPASDQAAIQSLADDVSNGPPGATNLAGTPLTAQAQDLISGLGSAKDTLAAFPTSGGEVCYEVMAAGACGTVDKTSLYGAGISFGILSTRITGTTRVYGVASDEVAKVDVEINGVEHPATLANNGFYYQLPDGVSGDDVQQVVATWNDGSVHVFPWNS